MLISRRSLSTLFFFTAVSLLITGCSRKEAPHSATLERNALMAIAFPGWQPSGAKLIQEVQLSDHDTAKGKPAQLVTVRASVKPMYVVKLDDNHAMMLTFTLPVEDDGTPVDCHACSNYIGAYSFNRDEAGWRLAGRQDEAAVAGVEGHIGDTKIVRLGSNGYALAAEWGSCWQGFCGNWLVVLGLAPERATLLADGIPLSAENTGAYEDCSTDPKSEASADATDAQPLHECFDVSGKWKPQRDRLQIDFTGETRGLDDKGQPAPVQQVKQQAIYAVKNGKLVLEQGRNPVPGF